MPENRKPQPRLDPRQPLVLDTRELGRRPGSMREMRLTAPAPKDLGTVLIGVPPGADIDLDLRLESVMEGVLVSGTADVPLTGECGRCLEPVSDEMVVDLQELFAYPESTTDATGRSSEPDEETARMEGDHLDLEPVLRDAVVLALPLTPLCRPDCAGLCAECGERLDDLPEDHAHGTTDARWGALAGLLETATGPDSTSSTTARPADRPEDQE
ncbi:MAG: YceD family protein [Actinomycetota bacterium]|nr:YceD family protein [Actinomycetota bacterium]